MANSYVVTKADGSKVIRTNSSKGGFSDKPVTSTSTKKSSSSSSKSEYKVVATLSTDGTYSQTETKDGVTTTSVTKPQTTSNTSRSKKSSGPGALKAEYFDEKGNVIQKGQFELDRDYEQSRSQEEKSQRITQQRIEDTEKQKKAFTYLHQKVNEQKATPTNENIITTGGNQIRQAGQNLKGFKVDDTQNTYGVPKLVEKGVRAVGTGVEIAGETVNVIVGGPVTFMKSLVSSADKRGEDGKYGFKDTVFTFNDAFQTTAKDLKQNAPYVSQVVTEKLEFSGNRLSQTGQFVKSVNMVPDPIETKLRAGREWAINKVETTSKTGVDFAYSGIEQAQKGGAVNRFIGTAKQDAGVALTILGETGRGILKPIETAKVAERALAGVQTDNKAVKFATNTGEVLAGGGAYAAEILSNPKVYVAGEFEEAAILAKNPTTRGAEIFESIATRPKDFLKASIGETIFVTGAFTLGKAILTDVQIGTKIMANEVTNIAIDVANAPRKPSTNFDQGSMSTPFGKPEYVSLDSINPAKAPISRVKPNNVQFDGEYGYKTNNLNSDFNLPELPNFKRPEINIGRNTNIKASEVGFIVGNSLNNSLVVGYKNNNRSEIGYENRNIEELSYDNKFKEEIKFDNKYDQKNELKFDEKYDFKNDNKTDYKFDEKYDYKYDYKYDMRTDVRIDRKTDIKIDYKLFDEGKSKKKKGFSFNSLDDGHYVASLGGALTGMTSKNPTKDVTGLKFRSVLIGRKKR